MMPVPRFFADYQERVDAELRRLMPAETERVGEAMAYTLLAPSKRVRPALTLLSAELCGGETGHAMVAACAVEMVHASSLILDDLPSMDDAAMRRGRPANHVVYGEAIAILAAFGLLDSAFGAIARGYEPALATRLTALLSDAVGADGLIGGQAADLLATDQGISFEMLERIHRGKTGALFSAAATAGAMTAGASARIDRRAAGVCQEPRAGVSNHRRPARRRGGSCRHGKAGAGRLEEDHIRLVQRRRRRAADCHRALSHRRSRAGALRAARCAPA